MELKQKSSEGRLAWAMAVLLIATASISVLAFGAVDPIALSLLSIGAFLILAIWATDGYTNGILKVKLPWIMFPLAGLLLLGIVQIIPLGTISFGDGLPPSVKTLSLDPYSTRIFSIRILLYLIFLAAVFTYMNSAARVRQLAIFLISFGSLLAFFAVLQKISDPSAIYGMRPTPQAIPFGPYVNQHHFASLMVMMLGLVSGILFNYRSRRDLLPLLIMAASIMTIAIIFSGSRGGILSMAAMLGTVLLISSRRTKNETEKTETGWRGRLTVIASIGLFAIAAAGLAVLLGAGESLFRGIGVSGSGDDFSSGRLQFWSVALQIFAANPIFGVGLDAFGVAYPMFDPANGMFRVEQAHNEYLQMMADGGIIALALTAGFVYLLIKNGLGSIANSDDPIIRGIKIGALSGCVGLLVHSFFDFPLRTYANGYIFLMLAAIATMSVTQDIGSKRRSSSRKH